LSYKNGGEEGTTARILPYAERVLVKQLETLQSKYDSLVKDIDEVFYTHTQSMSTFDDCLYDIHTILQKHRR